MRRTVTAWLCAIVLAAAAVHAQAGVKELNDAGWKALRTGYGDRAASLFAQALQLQPDDPVLLFGSGAAANAQGKQDRAIALLKRALELNPQLTGASRLLGQIAFAEGDVDLAVKTYENALQYSPGDPILTRELASWKRETDVHKNFDERRYDQFRVMFEGPEEKALARQATDVFHVAFRHICQKLGEYPTTTIVAVLYTQQEFRDITRAPAWSGGQYDGRIRVPVGGALNKPEEFERVLTHELAHAIVANIAPHGGIPHWLNEGLAQYFEGANPDHARKRMKALGGAIPLKVLEGSFMRLSGRQVQAAYDESLLAVTVMLDRPGFIWTKLLHELEESESVEATIKGFGWTYAELEAPFR